MLHVLIGVICLYKAGKGTTCMQSSTKITCILPIICVKLYCNNICIFKLIWESYAQILYHSVALAKTATILPSRREITTQRYIRLRSKWLFKTFCRACSWGCAVTRRWFSPDTPVSSTNQTDHHDVTEISLKVALSTINQTKPIKLVKIVDIKV